jgi:N-acetylmuramoyl-L-alanine amidase
MAWPWAPSAGLTCERNGLEPGFAVLWSDEGPPRTVEGRVRVGRAIITAMREAGFEPYSGLNYGGLYQPDVVPGGWVDLRPDGKNVYFLRASQAVPTVIVETHHARDLNEVARWQEPETITHFAQALAEALAHAFDLQR